MRVTRRAVATTLAVLGLTACSSSSPSSSASPSTTKGSSASATSTGTSQAESAGAQVIGFIPAYLGMLDDLRLDPSRPLDDIYQVAVAPEATAQASAIGNFRGQGYRQTGRSQLVKATVTSATLPSGSAAVSSPASPTVVVAACFDVGQVDGVDASGKSVVPPDRPRYLVEQLTVVNPGYPDPAAWRVSTASNRQASSCDG